VSAVSGPVGGKVEQADPYRRVLVHEIAPSRLVLALNPAAIPALADVLFARLDIVTPAAPGQTASITFDPTAIHQKGAKVIVTREKEAFLDVTELFKNRFGHPVRGKRYDLTLTPRKRPDGAQPPPLQGTALFHSAGAFSPDVVVTERGWTCPVAYGKLMGIVATGKVQMRTALDTHIQKFKDRVNRSSGGRILDVLEDRVTDSAIEFRIDPAALAATGEWRFAWTYAIRVQAANGEQGTIRFNFSAEGALEGKYDDADDGASGTLLGTSKGKTAIEMVANAGGKTQKKQTTEPIDSKWTATVDAKGNVTGQVTEAVGGKKGVPFSATIQRHGYDEK